MWQQFIDKDMFKERWHRPESLTFITHRCLKKGRRKMIALLFLSLIFLMTLAGFLSVHLPAYKVIGPIVWRVQREETE